MKYRSYISLIITMVLSVSVLILPFKAQAMPYFEDATVLAETMDLMIRPSTQAGVVTTLDRGVQIGVFCEERPGWYRVIYGNYRGYARTTDVFLPSTDVMYGNVLRDDLVVREKATPASANLGLLNAGYPIAITDMEGIFYFIEAVDVNGAAVEGYVQKEHINQTSSGKAEMVLKRGMEGAEVARLQKALNQRGFYGYYASGIFGSGTRSSLRRFQSHADLETTGIADQETLDILYSDTDIHSAAQDRGVQGSVMISQWSSVSGSFPRGQVATITDVWTGKKFKVQRYSGTGHADVEPLTTEDTAILKSCYGGVWSWNRRPVWVTVGSTTFAGSMNGMPHATHNSGIDNNGMSGQICIHFKDSLGHSSGVEDEKHAQMVKDAYFASIY